MERLMYLNGRMIPESDAKISAFDIGFKYGAVFYESIRTFNHKPYKLEEHLDRLERSLVYVGLEKTISKNEIRGIILKVIDANKQFHEDEDDMWINAEITPGEGSPNPLVKTHDIKPTVIVYSTVIPYDEYVHCYSKGKRAVISNIRNVDSQSYDMRVKHRSRLHFYLAKMDCARRDPGAFALLLDLKGYITEGTGANFFISYKNVLYTPKSSNILNGISRQTVFELADELGIKCVEADINAYDVYNADEAFFSTSSYCILPVSQVDGKSIGRKLPGTITSRLLNTWSDKVGIDIVAQAEKYAKNRNKSIE